MAAGAGVVEDAKVVGAMAEAETAGVEMAAAAMGQALQEA